MEDYKVTVYTSKHLYSDTSDYLYITLVGTDDESERTLIPGSRMFGVGSELKFKISCASSIGKLTLIRLDKQPFLNGDNWFPAKVVVESPDNITSNFPVYRWITDSKVYSFREGNALTFQQDTDPCGRCARSTELKNRKENFCWDSKDGMPGFIKEKDPSKLPPEVAFSYTKSWQFMSTAIRRMLSSVFKRYLGKKTQWRGLDHITTLFNSVNNNVTFFTEYVPKHWKDDDFFGYQFLNGANPMVIRRCTALPDNFPVPDKIEFSHGLGDLAKEIEERNIFLCDYKILEDIPTNVIDGREQYLMAPLVLLHKTGDNKIMPIAIQLKQKPATDNPIFFPTDSEYDWLLAKIFVRSADFNMHAINTHLLRTHLLAEVFAVALVRNIPMVHPLYKLLIPHTRYTLYINTLARQRLISADGVLSKFSAAGGEKEGMFKILEKSLSSLTYSSLCIPDDIAERGLEDVPNFYYKEDGIKLWEIINRFVTEILGNYYKTDSDIEVDPELQKWIGDIFEHGRFSESSGIPQKFTNVKELIKFVTMVIFTGSAQHAAVNSGQYDYGAWMPNTPVTLQLPPPTKKGGATKGTMLKTFPDVSTTFEGTDTLYLLSNQSSDFVPLGQYPDEHFTEEFPSKKIKEFQEELEKQSLKIKNRNQKLVDKGKLPYPYLDPQKVENSVSI